MSRITFMLTGSQRPFIHAAVKNTVSLQLLVSSYINKHDKTVFFPRFGISFHFLRLQMDHRCGAELKTFFSKTFKHTHSSFLPDIPPSGLHPDSFLTHQAGSEVTSVVWWAGGPSGAPHWLRVLHVELLLDPCRAKGQWDWIGPHC